MMKHATKILALAVLLLVGCTPPAGEGYDFDLQGHRGARGVLPENSIPSFLLAVDQGADTIEMDVVVSADSQVVVSHEPWMSPEICSHPDGSPVAEEEAQQMNIYGMPYQTVQQFDCGSRGNPRFPQQEARPASKPLLSEALEAVEGYAGSTIRYNIEIKSRDDGDGTWHPGVDQFAALVYAVIRDAGVLSRTTIQSFDPRALEAIHRMDPGATVALLVSNQDGLATNLARLTFQPQIYSPNHELVHPGLVDSLRALGMTVVPWTVNETETMEALLEMGVDGIITDYPALGATLKRASTQQSQSS